MNAYSAILSAQFRTLLQYRAAAVAGIVTQIFFGLVDIPFRLYLGHIPATEGVRLMASQLVWTAAIVIAGRALLAKGERRLIVQGG